MKKVLISILAVAAVISCNKNTVSPEVPAGEPGLITFGVADLIATRAVNESNAASVETAGFNVAGVTSDDVTYFNELATKTDGSFATATKYYYPNGKTLDFYACHPVNNTITVAGGVATLDYVQSNAEDLIVAKKLDVAEQSGEVELVFDHVLSQIVFTALGSDSAAEYKLRSIVVNAPNGGTYKYADNTWTRGELADVTFYNTELAVSTAAATEVDESMTFLPGEVQLTVAWDCFVDGQLIASYTKSTPAVGETGAITVEQGKVNTINLILPNADAQNITFSVTVNPWGAASQDVTLN